MEHSVGLSERVGRVKVTVKWKLEGYILHCDILSSEIKYLAAALFSKYRFVGITQK